MSRVLSGTGPSPGLGLWGPGLVQKGTGRYDTFCPTDGQVTNRQEPSRSGLPTCQGWVSRGDAISWTPRVKPSTGFHHGTLWPKAWGTRKKLALARPQRSLGLLPPAALGSRHLRASST